MLNNFLFREEWTLAIRKRGENLLFEPDGTQGKFSIISNSRRYWCGDPFLFKNDGKTYVFFEMYDRWKERGVIGYREIYGVGKYSEMKIAFDCGHHLSYPNIFEKDGEIYIVPESYLAKCIQAYRAVKFPDKWEKCKVLVNNIVACDTTFIDDNYMIAMANNSTNTKNEAILFRKDEDLWVRTANNPIDTDLAHARCAGKIFNYQGQLIRPAQDCVGGYGNGINFRKIIEYKNNKYTEETIAKIGIGDVKHNENSKYNGVHTYNFDDDYEVIDLKISKAFHLISIISRYCGKVQRIFNRIVRK